MTKIVGGQADTYNTKWIRVMATGESTETHSVISPQDFYRFQSMHRAQMYISWLPLGPCPLSQGPLVVCAGSHTLDYSGPVVHCTEVPEQMYDLVGDSKWLSVDFNPGDLCIFNVRSVHASLKYALL